jgi:lipoprotein-anchoring transpeptidase ErfK/SrfK
MQSVMVPLRRVRACRFALAPFALLLALALLLPAPAQAAREKVKFDGYLPGTVVVKTKERRLYYVLPGGTAYRYPIGVGRAGKQWSGSVYIAGKRLKPDWSPPADVKRDNPRLPNVIKGGTPQNPMGAAALLLSGGGQYAIHGTNVPGSIGGFVSYGCFRMYNADIRDLYDRVFVGTPVVVMQ